jgi:large subunit ribosomal protein L9
MKLVLRSDVDGVGKKGDIVEVADGFGRNYLVPKGFAIKATQGVEDQAKAMRRSRDVKDTADRGAAEEIAKTLVPAVITITAKASGEGKLFGSVTEADVVKAVEAQTGVVLDRHAISMGEHIKTVGSHSVPAKLHSDVQFQITVEVLAS